MLSDKFIIEHLDVSTERTYEADGVKLTTIDVYPLLQAQDTETASLVRQEVLREVKEALQIEFKKANLESERDPFDAANLNDEHHILWKGEANAYSETIQYLNRLLELSGQLPQEVKGNVE